MKPEKCGALRAVERGGDLPDNGKIREGRIIIEKLTEDDAPVVIDYETGTIAFKLQQGPIKEAGLHGCQHTSGVEAFRRMLKYLNECFPCRENSITLTKYEEGLMWQEARTRRRVREATEGYNCETGQTGKISPDRD